MFQVFLVWSPSELLWLELDEPVSVLKLTILCMNFGSSSVRCQCNYFHRCRCCDRSECKSNRYGFSYSWPCLCWNTSSAGNQYGNILSNHAEKQGYGLPGKDAVVVWWGALRGAIGLALALVVYTEHFRYEFTVENGGSGYNESTTSVFVLEKAKADQIAQSGSLNWYQASSLGMQGCGSGR